MENDGLIAERFVAEHCEATFLSLWGMANPIGKNSGKELCDYLVVCDPDVIILSVKDTRLPRQPQKVHADRWRRRAIDASVRSVYGAERILKMATEVKERRGRVLRLPPIDRRRIHRVCVAFGGRGEIPVAMGEFGRGFVHVLDEKGFPIVLRALDTIEDLVHYLNSKRSFAESGGRIVFCGEENLLAFYLSRNRTIPTDHDTIIVDETCWAGLTAEQSYRAKLEADGASYAWDNVIEYVTQDLVANDLLFSHPPGQEELALRIMARESRFERRILSKCMTEVFVSGKVRARMVRSPSGVVYVFSAFPRNEDRQYRAAELAARCFVARSRFKDDACVVVGVASELATDGKKGLSFDLFMLDVLNWTADWEVKAAQARDEFGFFKDPTIARRHWDEYPKA